MCEIVAADSLKTLELLKSQLTYCAMKAAI